MSIKFVPAGKDELARRGVGVEKPAPTPKQTPKPQTKKTKE